MNCDIEFNSRETVPLNKIEIIIKIFFYVIHELYASESI